MTKANAVNLLKETDFRNLVSYYLMLAAKNIHNEDPMTPNHAERLTLAQAVELNPAGYVDRFGWRCILNGTIQGRADVSDVIENDSDLEFVINSEFNNFIG